MAIYDTHPVYPHQTHLRFAHEPLKSLYVFQRLVTTLLLVPYWALYHLLLPRRFRPRPSWSLRQTIVVRFYRRIYKVTEVAGVTWGTRNPSVECDNRTLHETDFQWIPPLPHDLRHGVVQDNDVPFTRVGTFVWPKSPAPRWYERRSASKSEDSPVNTERWHSVDSGQETLNGSAHQKDGTPSPGSSADGHPHQDNLNRDVEAEAGKPEVIGIFMHGGGYTQMSAHEKAGTSRIPRRLVKDKTFTRIYAVEYRLLQHAPLPAALQDAAAVYSHVVISQLGATADDFGVYRYPSPWSPSMNLNKQEHISSTLTPTAPKLLHGAKPRARVVLIGDSAGGNLVLGVARWIRDEGVLPPPDGLLLLSPSCDPSHAFPLTPSSYIPRPHSKTDYLVDTPEPRALLQRTFLGHHPLETIHSPYISPASPRVLRAYGHPVDRLWRSRNFQHAGIGAIAEAGASAVAIAGPAIEAPSIAALSGVGRPGVAVHSAENAEATRNVAQLGTAYDTSTLGSTSALSTPAASPVLGHNGPIPRGFTALERTAVSACMTMENAAASRPQLQNTMTFLNPMPRDPALRHSLFGDFPRSFVTVGDAERLEREITTLVGAMRRDGVRLHVELAKDAVHDILMLPVWDEKVREQVWNAIKKWVEDL